MNDSQKLLKETARGSKYAYESISIAEDYSKNKQMQRLLAKYKDEHQRIGRRAASMLTKGAALRPTMAAAMTRIHTNVSLTLHPEASRVADLMINGCNMGIKSLSKVKNTSPCASPEAISLANELIQTEKQMIDDMLRFVK